MDGGGAPVLTPAFTHTVPHSTREVAKPMATSLYGCLQLVVFKLVILVSQLVNISSPCVSFSMSLRNRRSWAGDSARL